MSNSNFAFQRALIQYFAQIIIYQNISLHICRWHLSNRFAHNINHPGNLKVYREKSHFDMIRQLCNFLR